MVYSIKGRIACSLMLACLQLGSEVSAKRVAPPDELRIGSSSEFWNARSLDSNYLEGLCDGLGSNAQFMLGELSCSDALPVKGRSRKYRFCGVRVGDPEQATNYFNEFYRSSEHSDLAPWMAVAAFNDKVCGENIITSRMSKIQAQSKCNRKAANMYEEGVSPEARKKQQEYCASLAK
jgi:hypothetical protein